MDFNPAHRLSFNLLDPKFDDLAYSIRRYYVDEFYSRHARDLSSEALVLDVGGKKIRKRGQFDIEKYNLKKVVYVNLNPDTQPDVIAEAENLPFEDRAFNVVICSEMLEHIQNPPRAIAEIYRVLDNHGIALICVPFLFRIHGDPQDFGRYTDCYWSAILQESGFKKIVLEKQGLFYSVMADFSKQYFYNLGFPRRFSKLMQIFFPHFLKWSLQQEQKSEVQTNSFLSSFTTGFGIVATKES